LPGREPFAPEATDAPQAPDEDVRPESAHTSVSVAFGFLLYVNANSTESSSASPLQQATARQT
jgi:hypothetical protein